MTDTAPQALVERFFKAFNDHNAEEMIACYHPDVSFCDPVFGSLDLAHASAMWRMLCIRGKDLQVALLSADVDIDGGEATWEATYTFSATGHPVVNRIHSKFRFKDGRILQHHDSFDLWRWARQALGLKGVLLGWTPMVKRAIQQQALRSLTKFIETSS